MSDRDANYRRCLIERMEESDRAIGYDKRCLQDDQTAFQKKSTYLRQFRDENKKVRLILIWSEVIRWDRIVVEDGYIAAIFLNIFTDFLSFMKNMQDNHTNWVC